MGSPLDVGTLRPRDFLVRLGIGTGTLVVDRMGVDGRCSERGGVDGGREVTNSEPEG